MKNIVHIVCVHPVKDGTIIQSLIQLTRTFQTADDAHRWCEGFNTAEEHDDDIEDWAIYHGKFDLNAGE